MKGADVLAEIEDILRTKPPIGNLCQDTEETFGWQGRAVAVIGRWSFAAQRVLRKPTRREGFCLPPM
jgi:hypothetical protein